MSGRTKAPPSTDWLCVTFGLLECLTGFLVLAGGVQLAALGGSWYYLLAGLGLTASGVMLVRRRMAAVWIFANVYLGTVAWALIEAGWNFWPQVPRIGTFMVMGLLMSLLALRIPGVRRAPFRHSAAAHAAAIAAGIWGMHLPHGATHGSARPDPPMPDALGNQQEDWAFYGRDSGATHFAPFSQINRTNISRLDVAWTFRTGEINETADFQATPLQVGNSLYFCTARNRIYSVDADTGRMIWSFDPKVDAKGNWNRCRGVGYFSARATPSPAMSTNHQRVFCDQRIIATTIDARLLALDARTGKPCPGFGTNGAIDLKQGLGDMKPGWYYPTSAPLVAGDRIIVGGWVTDNQSTDEPGGVVRAFSAVTGERVWAWDPGRTEAPTDARSDGNEFARSTPNFWGTATYDPRLGLVFIPTGNGSPDHFGGKRSPETDQFSTSVIALDVRTGRLVWHYQTVHHDLWDWDLSAPPTFADFPDQRGRKTPAIIQVGKAGQIFVLDRRTGKPLVSVEERAVPGTTIAGERTSPTQPYSTGMPQVIPMTFSEKGMWGATLFDQLACRIKYRQLDFKGQYTPPGTTLTPITPGYLGGMNWGGVAIDRLRDMLIVNDIRIATLVKLVPREQLSGNYATDYSHADYEMQPQEGTPYAVELRSFSSPLGLPCEAPPWGMITGIDLKTRKIAWQIPAGTLADKMKEMIGIGLPLPIGMPTLSSALATGSGITFHAGASDAVLRAWDTRTGRLLWKSPMPVGAQATPMSYISPKTGRQYVVVAAGGAPYSTNRGDYLIAYALRP